MNSTSKETILLTLKKGKLISGQELAGIAAISRTAVWKHIKGLRREGYDIQSTSGRGYFLRNAPDRLLPQEIKDGLQTKVFGCQVFCFPEVESTQDEAKTLARQGAPEGSIVLAEKQISGRGRMHRTWHTLPGGVSLSLILRPSIAVHCAQHLPLLAGVSVVEGIRSSTQIQATLKWPNDIMVGGKKAGGILTELSAEMDRIDFITLGIGLNVNCHPRTFPRELRDLTTSLYAQSQTCINRTQLVQHMLQWLENNYAHYCRKGFAPIRKKWKELSSTLGSVLEVKWGKESIIGRAEDIDQTGALILSTQEGGRIAVNAGDIIIRKPQGSDSAGRK